MLVVDPEAQSQNMAGEEELGHYVHFRRDLNDDHPVEQTWIRYQPDFEMHLRDEGPAPLEFREPTYDYAKAVPKHKGDVPAMAWLRSLQRPDDWQRPWDPKSTDVRTRLNAWLANTLDEYGLVILGRALSVVNWFLIAGSLFFSLGERYDVAAAFGCVALLVAMVNVVLSFRERP